MPDRRALGLVAAGTVLAATGALMWWAQAGSGTTAAVEPGSAAASTSAPVEATARPVLARPEPGSPRMLRIPALGVTAPVVPVRAPDRTLIPPRDPSRLGWWVDGAKPGAREGSALVAGHTVHTGGGALDHLEDLRPGDAIVVRTDRGTLRYVVERVRTYTKGRIADDAERLFSQDAPGRLVVVTCEEWDGRQYLSNVVVTATIP